MSELRVEKPMRMNLSNGFTMFSSITVQNQNPADRKVIFQIAGINTPLKLTLGLDEKNDLAVWLVDVKANSFKSKSISKNRFFKKLVNIHFSVIPRDQYAELPKLEIGVNDYFDQTEVDADLGSDNDYLYSIGGNLNGNENAAFNMAALSIYNIALSDVQIKAVANALAEEFRKKNG